MELIANGRLGTAVKKAHLLSTPRLRAEVAQWVAAAASSSWADVHATLALDDGQQPLAASIDHYSLTWSGFGT